MTPTRRRTTANQGADDDASDDEDSEVPQLAARQPCTHTVRRGDAISKIARSGGSQR